MRIGEWVSYNWFSVVQSFGIIGSLLFTSLTLRMDAKERRASNDLAITQAHREHWANFFKRPELSRVLDAKADLALNPVTTKEEMFILQSIVHLSTALEVLRAGKFTPLNDALRKDIEWFFSLPVPEAVWERVKGRQEIEFVRFVELCRKGKGLAV